MNEEEYLRWRQHCDFVKSNILSQASRIEHLMSGQMAMRFSFNTSDIDKVHRIFFETNRISFYGLIELYKQYLKEFENAWLEETPDFFKKLEEIKTIRNHLAHGINPMPQDVKHIEYNVNAPSVLLHTYKKGELIVIQYSPAEIKEFIETSVRVTELLRSLDEKIKVQRNDSRIGLVKDILSKIDSSQDKNRPDSEP